MVSLRMAAASPLRFPMWFGVCPKCCQARTRAVLQVKRQRQKTTPKAKAKEKVTVAKAAKTKSGKETETPTSKGKGDHASVAMHSHIEEARIIRAKGRSYITGVFGEPKKRTLVVEISEKMTCNHVKLIEANCCKARCRRVYQKGCLGPQKTIARRAASGRGHMSRKSSACTTHV